MKRKIVIGLAVYSVVFLLAGIYVVRIYSTAGAEMDKLITLHNVQILKEHYSLQIRRVQSDFSRMTADQPRDFDAAVRNAMDLGRIVNTCFECHDTPQETERLNDIKRETERYKIALSRISTAGLNPALLAREEDAAFRIGRNLTGKIREMIAVRDSGFGMDSRKVMREMKTALYIPYGLVALGTLASALLGLVFIMGLTQPIKTLLESTRKLQGGDLDHRITGLKGEFGELAAAFNEMAESLKEQMRRMREAQEQMVRAETMAAVGTLSSGISHELSAPLSVIQNMAELARQDVADNPSLTEDLKVIEDEAKQAIAITRTMRGFAKSPQSKIEPVDVNEVLEEIFRIIEFQPRTRSILIVKDLAADLPPIRASAVPMRQVFLNVILNSIQAMPDGGELRVATWSVPSARPEGIRVSISDTGTGIPHEHLRKIFQPFFTTKEEGTGLGLAISLGIVQAHNGRIDVESEAGKGTTFHVFLPLAGAQESS
ncbi:MAG: ATP-binding protein [Thermodesulfobacteriota bacterium]